MSHWATFKQTATNLWVTLRHDILALAVFLNGLLIFKTIYGMSVNLLDIFHIKAFSELDLSLLANAPLFMLGVFLVLNSKYNRCQTSNPSHGQSVSFCC